MRAYHLKRLDRSAYLDSVGKIEDQKTLLFAQMSLKWWDEHFLWSKHACLVLSNEENEHLCYLFYKIDRYRMYMTVHNIFTPLSKRRNGYAHVLLKMLFDLAISEKVGRFKLTSVSRSLDFYLSLGFVYWGVNSVGDYYCDLPIPAEGLGRLSSMIEGSDTTALLGRSFEQISKKVKGNEEQLSASQTLIYKSDTIKMGEHYRLKSLLLHKSH